jgi:hypothetical protein
MTEIEIRLAWPDLIPSGAVYSKRLQRISVQSAMLSSNAQTRQQCSALQPNQAMLSGRSIARLIQRIAILVAGTPKSISKDR